MSKLTFAIGETVMPAAVVEQKRRSVGLQMKLLSWAKLPVILLILCFGYFAGIELSGVLSQWLGDQGLMSPGMPTLNKLLEWFRGLLCILTISSVELLALSTLVGRVARTNSALAELTLPEAEEMAKLLQENPQLESHRSEVAKVRQFIHGDLLAVREVAEKRKAAEMDVAERARAEESQRLSEEKRRSILDQLHRT